MIEDDIRPTEPLCIGIIGASGRLGRSILVEALSDVSFDLVGGVASLNSPSLGKDLGELAGKPCIRIYLSNDYEALFKKSRVLIDVSLAANLENTLLYAREMKKPIVVGTTGHEEETIALMKHAAKIVPLFYAPNFSMGVAALTKAAFLLSQMLGTCTISIKETHHAHKKDRPSGTALSLAGALQSSNKNQLPPIQSARIGDTIGEHAVSFATAEEEITLSHRALSRTLFAKGALRAAKFLATQPCGFYSMDELLRELL